MRMIDGSENAMLDYDEVARKLEELSEYLLRQPRANDGLAERLRGFAADIRSCRAQRILRRT